MKEDNIRLSIFSIASTFAVGLAFKNYLRVRKEEMAKRAQIDKDLKLDLQAIANASQIMRRRIENGEIRSLRQLEETLKNEIEFNKIAIREE